MAAAAAAAVVVVVVVVAATGGGCAGPDGGPTHPPIEWVLVALSPNCTTICSCS